MFKNLNLDSPMFRFLTTLTHYLVLSLVYIVSCIPIITIGAASTACYITHHKVIENDEGYVWQTYWEQFRSNFKQATLLWLIMILLTAFLAADCYLTYFYSLNNASFKIIFYVVAGMSIFFVTWTRYWFPYIAHVIDPIGKVLKNTLVMTIIHLPHSFCLASIYALCIAPFIVLPLNISISPVTLVLCPAVYMWLSYKPLTKVFINYWDMSDGYTGEPQKEE